MTATSVKGIGGGITLSAPGNVLVGAGTLTAGNTAGVGTLSIASTDQTTTVAGTTIVVDKTGRITGLW